MPHTTLAIVEGQEAGREFSVRGTTSIGRDPDADVVMADSQVSPKHASLVVVGGGMAVQDLGSTSGTFVNGQRVTGSRDLQEGDRYRSLGRPCWRFGHPPRRGPVQARRFERKPA